MQIQVYNQTRVTVHEIRVQVRSLDPIGDQDRSGSPSPHIPTSLTPYLLLSSLPQCPTAAAHQCSNSCFPGGTPY